MTYHAPTCRAKPYTPTLYVNAEASCPYVPREAHPPRLAPHNAVSTRVGGGVLGLTTIDEMRTQREVSRRLLDKTKNSLHVSMSFHKI